MKVKTSDTTARFGAVSIGHSSDVAQALQRMRAIGIHHLVVTKDDVYTGMVSDRLIWEKAFREESNSLDLSKTVADVMAPSIPAATEETDVLALIDIMKDHTFSALPMAQDGVITGVMTDRDALAILRELIIEKDVGALESFTEVALAHPVVQKVMQSLSDLGI